MAKIVTSEVFEEYLCRIIDEYTAKELIRIPGIYEILSEEYNNDTIDAMREDGYEI